MDLALQPLWLYGRLRVHLFRVKTAMQVKKAKAAVLAESRKPLVVDDIEFPDTLGVGQVLVRVLHTSIWGAQLNEISPVKGPDKFLPHLLGHEASAEVV